MQSADNQQYAGCKKFANDNRKNPSNGLLRKSPSILLGFTATKLLIFRKCRKQFRHFLHFRKNNSILFCLILVKTFKMRTLQKSHFSQMILRFGIVSISQRPQQ